MTAALKIRSVVAVVVLCLLSGCSTPSLVGAWRSKVQFENGAFAAVKDLEFLYVFNAGGTMMESSNYDSAPPVPPAYGVWRSLGSNVFEAKYVFYATKPPEKFEEVAKGGGWMVSGRGVLIERVEVAPDGNTFQSQLSLSMFDPAGKPIEGGGKATGVGDRIK